MASSKGPNQKIRYRTCLRNTIYDALRNRAGWTETENDVDWDFVWADIPWMKEHFDSLRLEENQRVNHFRNHYELTRKDLMVKNLKRMKRQLEKEGKTSEASKYDFFPVTFILPNDYNIFVEEFKRQPNSTWIAKPIGKAQGRGIFLFNDLKDLREWKKANEQRNTQQYGKKEEEVEAYIAQRYIENPYLIGGKKFDLRIYALVTSYAPLTVWLYRSGFARFSNMRFSMLKDNLGDVAIHLTNVAIQKQAANYDKDQGCKWELKSMKLFLISKHGLEAANNLMHDIQMLILRSLLAVQKVMMNDKHCFELYGYDVMIDNDLKAWLIEVNASPSLTADTSQDYQLKVGMLDDMCDVVDMEKKLTGSENQVGGFDLIYNNGPVQKVRPVGVPSLLGCSFDRKSAKKANAQKAKEK
mmetsp:Transcript_11780/g.40656  ORF Transcript_11780/g.40656 Transcript_11780/m.40656 type:complete len:413 (-) Transcript_11780:85-1323(-)